MRLSLYGKITRCYFLFPWNEVFIILWFDSNETHPLSPHHLHRVTRSLPLQAHRKAHLCSTPLLLRVVAVSCDGTKKRQRSQPPSPYPSFLSTYPNAYSPYQRLWRHWCSYSRFSFFVTLGYWPNFVTTIIGFCQNMWKWNSGGVSSSPRWPLRKISELRS